MENFEDDIAELLEVDSVTDTDVLEDFESWDSLTILSIIAYIDESYNVTISASDLKETKTVGGLKDLVKAKVK